MGIFADLFRLGTRTGPVKAAGPALESMDLTDPRIVEFLRGSISPTESGAVITPSTSLKVATAYRCVAIISSAVKTLPIDLKRLTNGKRTDATDSPLWNLLRRKPNPWMTPSEFKQLMQVFVLLRGNGYSYIQRDVMGKPTALIPLVGQMVVGQDNTTNVLTYKYTRIDGTQTAFKQQDIFHLKGLSLDGLNGMSVISYARESLGLSLQSEKHAAKMFKNGTSIAGVIEHPKTLDEKEVARLKTELDLFRGSENAHKNLVLESGMKYTKLDMTANDLQFIQNREMTQTEIAMFFGVPPHMLGLTNKVTSWGAGIEQQGIGFVTYTLQDWLTMWEESIVRDLVPDNDPTMYCRLNPALLVRGDIKTRYLAYAVGRQWGWLSANDVRAVEDMDAVDGGDVYLQAVNMVDANHALDALLAAHAQDPNNADPNADPAAK